MSAPLSDEEIARRRARVREYRRKRRAAGLDGMGNRSGEYIPGAPPVRMVLSPWTVERNGVMSRELRGI
jgi:hypothetical protein